MDLDDCIIAIFCVIALGTLLRRMPQLRLAADPEELTWRASIGLRGLKHLPVRF